MPKEQYMCQLCANHGHYHQPKKGHKWKCPNRNCTCSLCSLNMKRRVLDQIERQWRGKAEEPNKMMPQKQRNEENVNDEDEEVMLSGAIVAIIPSTSTRLTTSMPPAEFSKEQLPQRLPPCPTGSPPSSMLINGRIVPMAQQHPHGGQKQRRRPTVGGGGTDEKKKKRRRQEPKHIFQSIELLLCRKQGRRCNGQQLH